MGGGGGGWVTWYLKRNLNSQASRGPLSRLIPSFTVCTTLSASPLMLDADDKVLKSCV